MAELVPKHGFPVRGVAALGRGAVGRDHPAEADAEQAVGPGKAERPDGELLALREDLDDDGARDRRAVLLAERLFRPSAAGPGPAGRRVRPRVDPSGRGIRRPSRVLKPGEAVPERRQVVGDDVIGIAGEDLGSQLPALRPPRRAGAGPGRAGSWRAGNRGRARGHVADRRSPRRIGISARACGRSGGRPRGSSAQRSRADRRAAASPSVSLRRWASTAW